MFTYCRSDGDDETAAGAKIAAAVVFMKTQRRKLEQVNVVSLQNVFKQRRGHFTLRTRRGAFALTSRTARRSHFQFRFICRETERESHTPVRRIGQTANANPGRIPFHVVEKQQRRLRHKLRRRFNERADLTVPIRALITR